MLVKSLRGRQNHILARAFDGLSGDEQALLGAIAMTNFDLPMDVLRIINPKRPIELKKVDKPERRTEEDLYFYTSDPMIYQAYEKWEEADSPESRAVAHRVLNDYIEQDWMEQKKTYETYLAAQQIWVQKAADSDEWLLRTLPRLEERGLLQFDASSETLDMHPAIRHTAMNGLSPEARSSTGVHVSDALSSRPRKPFDEARSLEDLALAVTRVQALNAAGQFEAGWSLLIPELGNTLSRLEREDGLSEILYSYFPEGWDHPPKEVTKNKAKSVDTLHWAARALPGDSQVRRKMEEQVLRFDLSFGYGKAVCGDLCNWPLFHTSSPIACRFRLLVLAKRLAEALEDEACTHTCLLSLGDYHLYQRP